MFGTGQEGEADTQLWVTGAALFSLLTLCPQQIISNRSYPIFPLNKLLKIPKASYLSSTRGEVIRTAENSSMLTVHEEHSP